MFKFRLWLESSSNEAIIKNAFSRGVSKSDASVIGYHGTSIQTIIYAINTGFLPVTAGTEHLYSGLHQKHIYGKKFELYGIHIVPNPNNKVVKTMPFKQPLSPNPMEEAEKYAKVISQRHSVFDQYSLDWFDPKHHEIAKTIDDIDHSPEYVQKKFKLSPPKAKFLQAGVVLALSETIVDDFAINVGGDGDDINIITKELPIKYIVGIEPIDDAAYDWLDSLP